MLTFSTTVRLASVAALLTSLAGPARAWQESRAGEVKELGEVREAGVESAGVKNGTRAAVPVAGGVEPAHEAGPWQIDSSWPGESLIRGWFKHSDPDDPARHHGWGLPLSGESWRNRPWHVGWFVGSLDGDSLLAGRVDQQAGLFGGYRVGCDFDHYWGTEARIGFAHLDITDSQSPPVPRTARNLFFDAHLLYYPWGDAWWRPYATMGMGVANFRFEDDRQQFLNEYLFHLPIGIGVKWRRTQSIAFRLELMDNLAFSQGELDTMHNVSLTAGVEVHFGGRRRSYFPW